MRRRPRRGAFEGIRLVTAAGLALAFALGARADPPRPDAPRGASDAGERVPAAEPAAPAPASDAMRGHSFLMEEAYNQDARVVQHSLRLAFDWEKDADSRERGIELVLTEEWPLGSARHQLSFSIPFRSDRENARHGGASGDAGVGDATLRYRHQLWDDARSGIALAPSVSLVLPTGDEERDLGRGAPGYGLSLPLSHQARRASLHLNLGATFTPNARSGLDAGGLSPRRDLLGVQLGASAVWTESDVLQPMLELLALRSEGIDNGDGRRERHFELVASPGLRWAPCRRGARRLVLGTAVPIGLTSETLDVGFLLYVSFEHPY